MKILVVSGTFHPEVGGPPTYLYGLLEALVEQGHKVAVITYGDDVPSHAYPYPVTRISRRPGMPLRLLRFTREILRQGRAYDLLFVSDYGFPAALANMVWRKPVVIKVVSDFAWEFCQRRRWISDPISTFQFKRYSPSVEFIKALRRFYVNQADRIIVPSEHVRNLVSRWNISFKKIETIYNAVKNVDDGIADRIALRSTLGLDLKARLIITVGRLIPIKHIDKIIDLLPSLNGSQLIIVGEGPAKEALKEYVSARNLNSQVIFTGAVPPEHVERYLKASDLFVLASETEGLSHVLLEAMAAGIPVVATAVGGNVEVIQNGVDGILVPPDDPERLHEAISRVLQDDQLGRQLSRKAREKVERVFAWDRMVERTLAIFDQVVAERGQRI